MKQVFIIIMASALIACSQRSDKLQVLESRIDSLENRMSESYKPGFGEFMSNIQAHHAKLWYAGLNQNWDLANFEIQEIMENLEDIQKYESERKESELIVMINPALDSVNFAIEQKNPELFKNSFTLLTNTCNECHVAAKFEFNVIKIPETPSFSNQEFEVRQ